MGTNDKTERPDRRKYYNRGTLTCLRKNACVEAALAQTRKAGPTGSILPLPNTSTRVPAVAAGIGAGAARAASPPIHTCTKTHTHIYTGTTQNQKKTY